MLTRRCTTGVGCCLGSRGLSLRRCISPVSPIRPRSAAVLPQSRGTLLPLGRMHVACAASAAQQQAQLPPGLKKIVGSFQMVPDAMARYKQLLFYATKLPPMPAEDHVPTNKVWVKPQLKEDGKVYWAADSDSQLTKGLAALLVLGLSGCTPQEIVQVDPSFIELLGLKQSLTPSRNNGFLNMLRLMQKKTLALVAAPAASDASSSATASASSAATAADHASSSPDTASNGSSAPATTSASASDATAAASHASSSPAPPPSAASSPSMAPPPPSPAAAPLGPPSATPLQDSMRRKLTEALKPNRLVIVDDSQQHAGHAAMRAVTAGKAGGPAETHFRVEVVSPEFEGMPLVKRQRWIYQLLQEEFGLGLHALSLNTKTPSEDT